MYPFSGTIPTRPHRHITVQRHAAARGSRPPFSMAQAFNAACKVFDVTADEVRAPGRKRSYAVSGVVESVSYLCTGYSHRQVARSLCRHRTSVIHARKRVQSLLRNEDYAVMVERVRKLATLNNHG